MNGEKEKNEEFRWKRRVHQLKKYLQENGDCDVPIDYKENLPLAKWVLKQRVRFVIRQHYGKSAKLTDDQISELESIGFVWGAKSESRRNQGKSQLGRMLNHVIWKNKIDELKTFREKNGHCRVPLLYDLNRSLSWWVINQRKYYKYKQEGKPSSLTDARIAELESVGFEWNVQTAIWKTRIEELKEFREKNGHCRVPVRYAPNEALAKWVRAQRVCYKRLHEGRGSKLTDAQIAELESVGFEWKAHDETFKNRIEELKAFREKNGHCRVPLHDALNRSLSWWVTNQRSYYKCRQEGKPSSLTDARIAELESVGFEWNVHRKDVF